MIAGGRLGRREWAGALLVTSGLAVFLVIVRPSDAHATASPRTWATLFIVVALGVGALLHLGRRSRGIVRTSALAAAAGVAVGLLSVLTKATTHDFSSHGVAAIGTWNPWALAVVGVIGLSLVQNAFRSGPLAVSLPLIDLGEPLVASIIALVAFGERPGALGLRSWAELLFAAIIVAVGVAVLDRSRPCRPPRPARLRRRPPPNSAHEPRPAPQPGSASAETIRASRFWGPSRPFGDAGRARRRLSFPPVGAWRSCPWSCSSAFSTTRLSASPWPTSRPDFMPG